MPSIFSTDEIKEYWTKNAVNNKQDPSASWYDTRMIQLEIDILLKFVDHFDIVLDAGCANGYKTVALADKRNIHIDGFDYVPEMVEEAKKQQCSNIGSRVSFSVGNILDMSTLHAKYDKVLVSRVIINLHDWDKQVQGINECGTVLKEGGYLLLSEATIQGLNKINFLRRTFRLSELQMPKFNTYIDETKLIQHPFKDLKFEKLVDFSSSYYVGTRVMKPLLYKLSKSKNNVGDMNSIYNKIFSGFPSVGGFGIQKLFVFRKMV